MSQIQLILMDVSANLTAQSLAKQSKNADFMLCQRTQILANLGMHRLMLSCIPNCLVKLVCSQVFLCSSVIIMAPTFSP